jgi:tritrans,polycis-undecaprenyl-diphosphate synthase [geranylgeranyl-diphosphate specific]
MLINIIATNIYKSYKIYFKKVVHTKMPNHLAIVPDGNRRFAKRLLKNPEKGHEWGMKKIARIMEWCRELDIRNVTFYALSLENLENRPKEEMDFLLGLAKEELDSIISDPGHWVHETRTRTTFFGHLEKMSPEMQKRMEKVRELTRSYSGYSLNLAIAYGGRQEIVDAARGIAMDAAKGRLPPGEINEKLFRSRLSTNGMQDPDLIIRTGGEKRTSNFLPFQSTYSELAFIDTLWPELEREEFMGVIRDYGKRERRFGR